MCWRCASGMASTWWRAKLREYGVSAYHAYGRLKGWSLGGVREVITQMLTEGFLGQTQDKYALLKVTAKTRELTEGEAKLILKRPKRDGAGQQEESGSSEREGSRTF